MKLFGVFYMNEEIELEFKRALETIEDCEVAINNGRYNNSINRSYYAVFHATKALLLKKGIVTESDRGALQFFGKEYIKTGEFNSGISKILYSLFDDRENADYDVKVNFTKEDALINILKAKNFIKECENFL
jgi:uncharacterized protein (UPF0332 family)